MINYTTLIDWLHTTFNKSFISQKYIKQSVILKILSIQTLIYLCDNVVLFITQFKIKNSNA